MKNIYNNIDNIPNLKIFTLECDCKDITKEFYKEFIIKLMKLNLDKINLNLKGNNIEKYSKKELKKLIGNCVGYKNFYIEKMN